MRAYLKIKMAAERQRLRRVLNRFKKEELPNVVRWLGGKENVSKKRSKKDIVSSTVDACVVSNACGIATEGHALLRNKELLKILLTSRVPICVEGQRTLLHNAVTVIHALKSLCSVHV